MNRIIFSALLLLASSAFAADGGILYGKDNVYFLKAPEGWVLDSSSGKKQGLHAVFYPENGSWKNSKTVMYSMAILKQNKNTKDLASYMAYALETLKKRSSKLTYEDRNDLKSIKGKKAKIRTFQNTYGGNTEVAAYFNEGKSVTLIVMTSRNQDDFDKNYSSFEELIKSYVFIGTEIKKVRSKRLLHN